MKKFISIAISVLLIAGMFAACQSDTASDAGSKADSSSEVNAEFTPGVYTSTKNGFSGPVTVETTFGEDGAIESVNIVQQYETAGIQQAINVVPEAIVENQSVAVDTVSGATFAGLAVINSVKELTEDISVKLLYIKIYLIYHSI